MNLSKLFTPCKIGSLEIKNRVVMPAMHLNYTPDGEINDRVINFYAERARGGVGLLIVGGCAIDDVGSGPMMINVSEPRFLDGLKKFTNEMHKEGAKVAAQLYQAGRYAHSAMTGKQAVAPSPVASRLTREEPRELTIDEIKELIETFARAAALVKEAGFDAVEVLASAGYIIPQFLSPVTNKRNDEYGGSFENRMRFGLEVISRIKETVGADYPVIVRVAGNDFMPGGNTNAEAVEFCRNLEKAGADCFNVTGGWHETRVPQLTMRVPHGAFVYLAENIKKAVSVPVIACNRINSPELAEQIIEEDRADFAGIARGLIADPDFSFKAGKGEISSIRKCIACNQGCLDMVFSLQKVICLVNPRAGREEETPVKPVEKPKKILVVGGGVSGMETARVAAMRRHDVTLWEEKDTLGGQMHLAAAPPGRSDFMHLVTYLTNALLELRVKIQLNYKATPDKIMAEKFDAVVIATGASDIKPDIPGVEGENVVRAWDVLAGNAQVGDNVVVIGGGAVGVETSLLLAEQGTISAETLRFLLVRQAEKPEVLYEMATKGHKKITLVEMLKGIGKDIGLSTRWTMLDDLKRCGVTMMDKTTVKKITSKGVIAESEGEETKIPADTIVLAVGSESENLLYNELKEKSDNVFIIGDAEKPRKALEAMHDAFDLAAKI